MTSNTLVLSTAYMPPTSYVRMLCNAGTVLLEKYETYTKQTCRNRSYIYSTNGVLPLSIPVKRPNGNKTKTCDIEIDYSTKWPQEHWRAIVSAYNKSAYFEFLSDYFEVFYLKQWKYLWDFNLAILHTMKNILEVEVEIKETDQYLKEYGHGYIDMRNFQDIFCNTSIKPHIEIPYFQVFEAKYGFIPNLSTLDLLCSLGMESLSYLK